MIVDDAYDKFDTLVASTFIAHGLTLSPVVKYTELADNIIIENNDDKSLKNGYAIEWAGDVNDKRELSGHTGFVQNIFVTITTANFGTIRNIASRKAAEKSLLKAKDALAKAVAGDSQLGGTVAQCTYESSDPISLIIDDENKVYSMIRSTYTIGYFEECTEPGV